LVARLRRLDAGFQIWRKSGRIRHEIILAPDAVQDLKALKAFDRAAVKDAMEKHLSA
jgi:hypothetical protein